MSKLTDLKLKQQAITEWWAVRRFKRIAIDPIDSRNLAIVLTVLLSLAITLFLAWVVLRKALPSGFPTTVM